MELGFKHECTRKVFTSLSFAFLFFSSFCWIDDTLMDSIFPFKMGVLVTLDHPILVMKYKHENSISKVFDHICDTKFSNYVSKYT